MDIEELNCWRNRQAFSYPDQRHHRNTLQAAKRLLCDDFCAFLSEFCEVEACWQRLYHSLLILKLAGTISLISEGRFGRRDVALGIVLTTCKRGLRLSFPTRGVVRPVARL